MRGDGLALHTLALDHPRLDDDAAGPEAHTGPIRRVSVEFPAAVAFERRRLSPSAAGVEAAARLALAYRMHEAAQVTALLGHRAQDQRSRRARPFSGSAPRSPEARFKIARVVFRHVIELACGWGNTRGAQIDVNISLWEVAIFSTADVMPAQVRAICATRRCGKAMCRQ